MTTPPTGPDSSPKPKPDKPPSPTPPFKPSKDIDKEDAYLLNSPFAQMFRRAGAEPTAKEMRAIINGILQQQIQTIKKQDAAWKAAMRKLKEAIEGNE